MDKKCDVIDACTVLAYHCGVRGIKRQDMYTVNKVNNLWLLKIRFLTQSLHTFMGRGLGNYVSFRNYVFETRIIFGAKHANLATYFWCSRWSNQVTCADDYRCNVGVSMAGWNSTIPYMWKLIWFKCVKQETSSERCHDVFCDLLEQNTWLDWSCLITHHSYLGLVWNVKVKISFFNNTQQHQR